MYTIRISVQLTGVLLCLGVSFGAQSQSDSTHVLSEVIVSGYRNNRMLKEVPASIAILNQQTLNRFSTTSIVPAVNSLAGVRMEERSPGSYRFSIRGSLLRSPFGVRNVKFYWNGLPLTDGGGNTYLNLLDFTSIGTMEIIKGPSASLYGAGTGGVVLLTSPPPEAKKALDFSLQYGSFGSLRAQANATLLASQKNIVSFRTSFQCADGYREQTAMKRVSSGIDWSYYITPTRTLTTSFFTSNLFYETPGGLTKVQWQQNPQQARPAGGPNPGAVEQQAAVTNTTSYLSSMYEQEWNKQFTVRTGLFASYTRFKNPSIRNYEKREERNIGGRAEVQYLHFFGDVRTKTIVGGEYQYFYSPLSVYDNLQGSQGDAQTLNKLASSTGLLFAQSEWDLPHDFFLTLGGSINFLNYDFQRTFPLPVDNQTRKFTPTLFPRVALLKKFSESFSVFGSVSDGFSPPSLAEVRPSTGTYNNLLKAERGINFETGLRGNALANTLRYDITLYSFRLRETIVIQRTGDGAEYFVNAGETSQQGIEFSASWSAAAENAPVAVWLAYSLNDFYFDTYVQDGIDFSGNRLTGVAPHVASFGFDFLISKGMYVNTTLHYTDHIPLNDANSEYAPYYWLVGTRAGYKRTLFKNPIDFFIGVDNLLNETYSLGNDLNAIGGRYYNAAPERNYYIGFSMGLTKKK